MTDNTDNTISKAKRSARPLVRKRPKQERSNLEFDAFIRRILRAYAARIAAGDLEALRSMATLSAEVDAIVTLAVAGLRKAPYSWTDIGSRLGTSRQAAQMRYGDRSERDALDQRLIEAGMSVTVSTLVAVFADHHPGIPAESTCSGCGFVYPEGVPDCPTNTVVRPLLYRRRAENKQAFDRLTAGQYADLHKKSKPRTGSTRAAAVQTARTAASPARTASTLFEVNGKD